MKCATGTSGIMAAQLPKGEKNRVDNHPANRRRRLASPRCGEQAADLINKTAYVVILR